MTYEKPINIDSISFEEELLSDPKAYDLNNLVAEIVALRKWWSRGFDLLHYLDGEHSLQLLPFTIRKLNFLRTRPPIVATFHQPPTKLSSVLNFRVVRQLDHVIVLSPEQKSYFEQYLPESKVSLILHGINVDLVSHADSCSGEEFTPAYCRVEESDETNNDSDTITLELP